MARPTILTPELSAEICRRLEETGSLRRVCMDSAMPLERTVRRWYTEDPQFASEYARAKAAGIDALVDESLDIVDEPPPMTAAGATDSGHVAWAKTRVEYRRWLAERMAPKKYGLRTATEISGPDGGPVQIDETSRNARIAALLSTAKERSDLV